MPGTRTFELDARQLDQLFPFHIVFDRKMTIVQVGTSITRVWPAVRPGVALPECVSLSSPRIAFTFDELADHQSSLVLLQTFTHVILRGQVVLVDANLLMFVGSPYVSDPKMLERIGVNLTDFALHDSVADYMFLLQAQAAALDDARELAVRQRKSDGGKGRHTRADQGLALELNALPDLVIRVGRTGTLLEVRTADETNLRAQRHELIGRSVYVAFPEMTDQLRGALDNAFTLEKVQTFAYSLRGPAGETFYEARVVRCSDHEEALVLVRDVTERHEHERELVHQAFHDSLTGLANRAFFEDRVSRAIARTTGAGDGLAVLFIDLDDFKALNDTLGQHIGDSLLVAVTERLQEVTRPGDTIARLGGDEFAILVEGGRQDVAESLAHRLIEAFERPFDGGTQQVALTASIGVATRHADVSAEDLLRNADMAMYAAKRAGKGRPATFEASMQDGLLSHLLMETELRHAVSEKRFVVLYQPVVDISTGAVVGAEALVRWQHPSRGLLAPSEFIPLAEQSDSILGIGSIVLTEACRQAVAWDADIPVSINVSTRQLSEPGLLEAVEHALELTGLDPRRLVIEVTESSLISDAERAARVLGALKGLGVHLALDDFGAGFSSLGHLLQFPIDTIKVDRSFVEGVTSDGNASAMVGAILGIGGILGIDVVAKGVEHVEQLDLLRRWHCPSCQGYLFARPVESGTIRHFLHGDTPWAALIERDGSTATREPREM